MGIFWVPLKSRNDLFKNDLRHSHASPGWFFHGRGLLCLNKSAKINDSENENQFNRVAPPPLIEETAVIDRSIPLNDLPVGRSALVSRITGQPDHVHRLEEFGLCGGTRIRMFRRGNPCILRMAGQKVCFRVDDLLRILVEPSA